MVEILDSRTDVTRQVILAAVLAFAVSGVATFAKVSQPDGSAHGAPTSVSGEIAKSNGLPSLPDDLDKSLGKIRPCDSADIEAAIRSAVRVESFQLDPDVPMNKGSSADRFRGYKIVAEGRQLNESQRSRLKDLLLDPGIAPPETFRSAMAKLCYLSPHHALRMTGRTGEPVDVIICFGCGDVWVARGDAPSVGGDFSIIEKDVKALCLQIFPDDPHVL